MRTISVFLYIFCLTRKGVNGSKFLQEYVQIGSYDGNLKDLTMSNILKDIITNPLKDRRVTLILREEDDLIEGSLDVDHLVKTIESPVALLRLPKENNNTNFAGGLNLSDNGYEEINSFPLENSIAIIVMNGPEDLWWPLWSPPKEWVVRSVIFMSSSKSCLKENESMAPLLERPKSLAIICPHIPQKATTSEAPFKVWTKKPLSSGKKLVDLGPWNGDLFKSWNDLFIDRFQDMTNKSILIVADTEDRPFIYITPDDILKGVNYFIMDTLSQWLNFDLLYTTYGSISWTTMFDSIKKGENDVFINYATITPERNNEFDLTVPYCREGFAIMLEVPPPLPRWQNVLFPFTWPVWVGVILSLFCTAVTYHLLYHDYNESFATNAIYITQSLLSNPMETLPTTWRVRNFLLVWMFGSWFLNMSYTCNLIAVLTIPIFPYKIQTVKELTERDYRLCMVDYGEFVDEALAASTDPTLSALGDKLDMVPSDDSMEYIGQERCIEKVLAGTHAHTETYSYVEILYNKLGHGAKVYSFREQLYPGYLALLLQKNTPWKYKFDTGIQSMFEMGLIQKWYREAMESFTGYFREEVSSEVLPLTLGHLQGPFLLNAIGLFLSFLVMAGEVLYPEEKTTVQILP